MARAARSMARTAVSTMFRWPAQAIQKGLTCCTGVSSTVASHETDNTPIQPSTTSVLAGATTHIFSGNKTTLKQPHKSCQPSPSAKARLSKLSGLWSWVTDPTGFDHASDKLKAQRRAAKLSRARAHLSIAGGLDTLQDFELPGQSCLIDLSCTVHT